MSDNRLGVAVSPYLRQHADNPVDWREWGPEAFAEAATRDVPVLVSIGYATCHWCHVMARESFSDPDIAAVLRAGFVSVKVDREERPDVDASAMIGASVFTQSLGWPLTVFMTPDARVFHAGTYSPPVPVDGHPSFRQVLAAVQDAWTERRAEVEANAASIAGAIAAQAAAGRASGVQPAEGRASAVHVSVEAGGNDTPVSGLPALPDPDAVRGVVAELARAEDREHGGLGGAPKFPNVPLLEFLVDVGADGLDAATDLAERTVAAIAASELTDPVDGGVFRYATRRDWSVPHYERMLYDNAGLLAVAGRLTRLRPDGPAAGWARGIVGFLRTTLRTATGAFVAAQDSESTIDGQRVEGAWYRLDREGRARLDREGRAVSAPPPLDDQVLTGWNGLAIRGLAVAGAALDDPAVLDDARRAAAAVLAEHVRDGRVVRRATTPRGPSTASPTIEDVGLLAEGLLELALATGEVSWAVAARSIVDGALAPDGTVALVGATDPVLAAAGTDPGEQPQTALRSGTVALAAAASLLAELTGEARYRSTAHRLVAQRAADGIRQPLGHADALGLALALQRPSREVVLVVEEDRPETGRPETDGDPARSTGHDGDPAGRMRRLVRSAARPGTVVAVVTPTQCRAFAGAGFALFADRDALSPAAYVCHDRVCDLPARTPDALAASLAG